MPVFCIKPGESLQIRDLIGEAATVRFDGIDRSGVVQLELDSRPGVVVEVIPDPREEISLLADPGDNAA